MESLNMNTLAKSLPSSQAAKAEQELMDKFKAAAMSITTLYRQSLSTSKRHYDAGYVAALEDLMMVIQQGVSVGGASVDGESGMTIGRVMDWIEARTEAIRIKAREDEEEEEERDGKQKAAGPSTKATVSAAGGSDARDKAKEKAKATADQPSTSIPTSSLPTPRSSDGHTAKQRQQPPLVAPTSPSPPPPTASALPTPRAHPRARLRSQTQKEPPTPEPLANSTPANVNVPPGLREGSPLIAEILPPSPALSIASVVGAKRRHAAMMLDPPAPFSTFDSTDTENGIIHFGGSVPNPYNPVGGLAHANPGGHAVASRRRIRNARSATFGGSHGVVRTENVNPNAHQAVADAVMDVEDEGGRERKRVARR